MAEVVNGQVRGPIEPPGRTRNRRRHFTVKMNQARTTRDQLQAACDYFWGAFAHYSASEITEVCERLADFTDSERGRLRGT